MVKLKMSTNILRWTSPSTKLSRNLQHLSASNTNTARQSTNQNSATTKRWVHDDKLLVDGHVAYLVKFLGNIAVDQPKGLDTVRDSIKKLEFQEHLKRSVGEKIRKIELTISVGGVAIREAKTKQTIHQFPLHRISYCADDKSERKYLSFISKLQEDTDRHECFVFVSDKLSEEIALTIGQAFDLAWRSFLNASGNDFDARRELVQAKKRIQELERKVRELEKKLKDNGIVESTTMPKKDVCQAKPANHQASLLTHTTAKTNQTIDLSMATSRLQSLIDLT